MLSFALFHSIHILLTVLVVQSLTMIWRAGMFDLGHFAYLALGAYIAATFSLLLPPTEWFFQSFLTRMVGILTLFGMAIIAWLFCSGLAFLFGRITTKFNGDYFAVATLVFSEAVIRLLSVWEFTGGDRGFDMKYIFASRSANESLYFNGTFFLIALALNVAVFLLFRKIQKSHRGLLIDAVRNDALAVDARGVDSVSVKLSIYVLCSGVAAVAGVMFLNFATIITPNDFSFLNSLPVVVCVILGNHKPTRAITFTIVLYVIYELAKLRFLGLFGVSIGELAASWKEAIYGVVLLASIIGTHCFATWKKQRVEK